jgi:hypothetical protein
MIVTNKLAAKVMSGAVGVIHKAFISPALLASEHGSKQGLPF